MGFVYNEPAIYNLTHTCSRFDIRIFESQAQSILLISRMISHFYIKH